MLHVLLSIESDVIFQFSQKALQCCAENKISIKAYIPSSIFDLHYFLNASRVRKTDEFQLSFSFQSFQNLCYSSKNNDGYSRVTCKSILCTLYQCYFLQWHMLEMSKSLIFNLFRLGEKGLHTSFSPVNSLKVGINPQNFLSYSFNPFVMLLQNLKAIPRTSTKLLNLN